MPPPGRSCVSPRRVAFPPRLRVKLRGEAADEMASDIASLSPRRNPATAHDMNREEPSLSMTGAPARAF